MSRRFPGHGSPPRDPALLAFIKCHLTSPTRWNALRLLAEAPDRWWPAEALARAIRGRPACVRSTLEELVAEALILRRDGTDGPVYGLDAADPTRQVTARLTAAAARSPALRQILIAWIGGQDAVDATPVSTGHRPSREGRGARRPGAAALANPTHASA